MGIENMHSFVTIRNHIILLKLLLGCRSLVGVCASA
jgi:hypothetical protein